MNNTSIPFAGFNVVLWGIIAIVLSRLVLIFAMGMMPQDAYYFFYSEHLDLSYFDHPPMVAVMLKFFTSLFGVNVIAVKLANAIMTIGTTVLFYKLAKEFLQGFQLHNALYLWLSTMMVSILSLITTPDVPLLFFWALSMISIYRSITTNHWKYWLLTGLAIGMTFNSKYTGVLLLGGLFGLLLFSKELRKYLLGYQFILVVIVFFITISPVIIWNIQNDWISIKFQSSDRVSDISKFSLNIKYFLGTIGTQIFVVLPVLFVMIMALLTGYKTKIWKNIRSLSIKTQFLLWFSVPIIFGFLFISLFYWVKLNWMMPAYIAAIILIAPYFTRNLMKHQVLTSLVFHIAFMIQVFYYPVSIQSDDTWWGWKDLAAEVKEIKTDYPNDFIFSDDGYKTSAELNFFLRAEKVYSGNVIGKHGLQFSMIDSDLSHLKGKDALFIDSRKRFNNVDKEDIPHPLLDQYFETVEQLSPIVLYNVKGQAKRKFLVYRLTNYRPQ